jgi:hypothetical protein
MERLSHEPIITPAHKKVYLLTLIRTAKDKKGLVLCEDQMLWKKYGKIQKNTYSYIWMSKFEKLCIFLLKISFKGSKH